ncbi:hypothetical protein E2P64_06465 [Candidatus Bathyarchaeota archaeon]|nr:hypothetical protein E2P64_06465 [Candidatus Bathyarchaeota archaeon]
MIILKGPNKEVFAEDVQVGDLVLVSKDTYHQVVRTFHDFVDKEVRLFYRDEIEIRTFLMGSKVTIKDMETVDLLA